MLTRDTPASGVAPSLPLCPDAVPTVQELTTRAKTLVDHVPGGNTRV